MGNYDAALVKRDFGTSTICGRYSVCSCRVAIRRCQGYQHQELKDLNGKKFNPGPAGGGSTFVTMQIFELFGIKPPTISYADGCGRGLHRPPDYRFVVSRHWR